MVAFKTDDMELLDEPIEQVEEQLTMFLEGDEDMNLAKHLRNVAKDANEVSFRKYRTAMYEKLKKKSI